MNIPKPQFHTQMLGDERVYWSPESMLFCIRDKAVLIPANTVSDGFSIPKLLRGIWAVAPKSLPAACCHDFLYSKGVAKKHGMSRRQVDLYFKALLKEYGMGFMRRQSIYAGVRIGGFRAFNRNEVVTYTGDNHEH